jgi:hypothetical protein
MGIAGFIVALGVGVALRAVLHLRSQRSHLPRRRQVPDADQVWQHQAGVTRYRVGELPDGEIGRVEGTVGEQARTLRGPLSGRACVYYMVLVEAGGAIQWTEGDGVAFALEDASGRAIIDPALARIALSLDHREPLRALREATPQQDAVLARHGYNVTGAGQLVFYEAVLLVGERVTVVGAGRREPAASQERDFRTPPPMQLRMAGGNAQLSIASHRAR